MAQLAIVAGGVYYNCANDVDAISECINLNTVFMTGITEIDNMTHPFANMMAGRKTEQSQ